MITATSPATQTSALSQSSGQSQASGLTSDFDTFLKMLTAQARNQDPLEPLDSSEYASQLAQFSMVEQQVQTNDHLTTLASALSGINLDELSNWVGVDVLGGSSFRFNGQPQTIFTEPDLDADQSVLVIKDAQGSEVGRFSVPLSKREYLWAGVDETGTPLPNGAYSATVESYKDGKILSSNPAAAYSRVIEAQVSDGVVTLGLDSGDVLPASGVTAIRAGA